MSAAGEPRTAHPLLVKYGLEGMAGDPVEVLHRHLTNNHAATLGAKDALIQRLKEQLAEALSDEPAVTEALRRLPPATCYRNHLGHDEHLGVTGAVWIADVVRLLSATPESGAAGEARTEIDLTGGANNGPTWRKEPNDGWRP